MKYGNKCNNIHSGTSTLVRIHIVDLLFILLHNHSTTDFQCIGQFTAFNGKAFFD